MPQIFIKHFIHITNKICFYSINSFTHQSLFVKIKALLLIENGADANVQDKEQMWSPLMHAISNSNEQITLQLLEKNCDLNKKDVDGNSALHLAVMNENDFLLKHLLKSNVDKNIFNKENQSPLDLAKLSEDDILIKLLS